MLGSVLCVYLAIGVSVIVPLKASYKYARQAAPWQGVGDQLQRGQGQRRLKPLDT